MLSVLCREHSPPALDLAPTAALGYSARILQIALVLHHLLISREQATRWRRETENRKHQSDRHAKAAPKNAALAVLPLTQRLLNNFFTRCRLHRILT